MTRLQTRCLLAPIVALGLCAPALADNGGGVGNGCTVGNGAILCTVPEPGVLELIGLGLAGAIAVRLIARRRK